MKITSRQLRRIIREETGKLAESPFQAPSPSAPLQTASNALSDIWDGIDKLIQAIGSEGARLELQGIVDEWKN